jgi:hypothetical protein
MSSNAEASDGRMQCVSHPFRNFASNITIKSHSTPADLRFDRRKNSMPKKLLLFFPLSLRFFLDIDAARFYTFFNCNITIADSMQPIEKGE